MRSVSVLLGATTATIVAGLVSRFHVLFDGPAPSNFHTTEMVVGVSLLAMAVGVRLPQRFALLVCAAAWRRFVLRGRPSQMSDVLLGPDKVDRPLLWLVLSVVALAGGVSTALLPVGVQLAAAAYGRMLAHFVWSVGPLAILQSGITFAAVLGPLVILGLAFSCVHQLSCPHGRWETTATTWALLGASSGVLVSEWIATQPGGGDLVLIVAALPALVTSLVSAVSTSARAGDTRDSTETEAVPLPMWSDRRPTLLRASIMAVAGGGACVLTMWTGHFRDAGGHVAASLVAMLLATGLGVQIGSRAGRRGRGSIGDFGVTCVVAGLIIALSVVVQPGFVTVSPWRTAATACASMLAVGFATAYGLQTLLSRVASRSLSGAVMSSRALVCVALTMWIATPLAEHVLGRLTTFLVLTLSLLVLGGALIAHEPGYSPRRRWTGLCAVLGSMGMILLALLPAYERPREPMSIRASSVVPSLSRSPTVETEYSHPDQTTDP